MPRGTCVWSGVGVLYRSWHRCCVWRAGVVGTSLHPRGLQWYWVGVRAVCRTIRFFHSNLGIACLHGACFVHSGVVMEPILVSVKGNCKASGCKETLHNRCKSLGKAHIWVWRSGVHKFPDLHCFIIIIILYYTRTLEPRKQRLYAKQKACLWVKT